MNNHFPICLSTTVFIVEEWGLIFLQFVLKVFQVLFLYSNLVIIFQDEVGEVSFTYIIFILFYILFLETSAFIFIFPPESTFCT